ncbi:hypothetical protein EG327_001990 [Venturia inaequalis]|uniref:AA1-like domain-containing protein n=1 Tax=Venturia inaequalis TaxID=5025 RepID=A0A8H3Z8X9_VENIN|nr:hypothetical protein EG327_001990 [Venturia inaequalis]
MLSSNILLSLVSLVATTTSAGKVFTGAAYTVNTLAVGNSAEGKFTLSFLVKDPEPLAPTTATCGTTWTGPAFPTQWIPCETNSVDFKLNSFKDIEDFEIQVKHSYRDPSVGKPPQDKVTTFAQAAFSAPENLTCSDSSCTLTVKGSALLPVWAAVA